jgi:hypothetical protein
MSNSLDLAFFILLAGAVLIAAIAWILRPWLYSLALGNVAYDDVRRERDELADTLDAIRVELGIAVEECNAIPEQQSWACRDFVIRVAKMLGE